jgi:hypothetical protein
MHLALFYLLRRNAASQTPQPLWQGEPARIKSLKYQ